jgi:hypothetical protein
VAPAAAAPVSHPGRFRRAEIAPPPTLVNRRPIRRFMTAPAATPPPVPARDFAGVFARVAPHMASLDSFLRGQLEAFEP